MNIQFNLKSESPADGCRLGWPVKKERRTWADWTVDTDPDFRHVKTMGRGIYWDLGFGANISACVCQGENGCKCRRLVLSSEWPIRCTTSSTTHQHSSPITGSFNPWKLDLFHSSSVWKHFGRKNLELVGVKHPFRRVSRFAKCMCSFKGFKGNIVFWIFFWFLLFEPNAINFLA